jgi:UDPglucose--hexose-1-phosphate uridylyltransferase
MQIIGTPEIPSQVVDKAVRFSDYRARAGGCLLCDLVSAEIRSPERVIRRDENWVALAPWASRFPWEVLLVPREHRACLTDVGDGELSCLAEVLSWVLASLTAVHGDLSLNLVIHSAPVDPPAGQQYGDARLDRLAYSPAETFHWHLEILPRLSRQAGFEVGTGFTINSVMPEEAARRLREEGT